MDQKICTNCGTANDSGVKFCVNCGTPFTVTSADTPESGNQQDGGYQQSQGGYQQPQSGYQQFQGGYQQSQGGYQQSQGGYQQSQGGYQQSQGGYQQSQGGYQQSQGGYQQSQGGYQQSQGGYQQYQGGYQPQPGLEQKSKLAAGLLGILLGALGIHNFYLGNTGKALAQLLISVLSCGILSIVSWIWGLVEGIMILTGSINTDARGIPLKE